MRKNLGSSYSVFFRSDFSRATFPLFRHEVHIFAFFTVPLITIRLLIRFGLKLLFEIPVILIPAPFFLLARPLFA